MATRRSSARKKGSGNGFFKFLRTAFVVGCVLVAVGIGYGGALILAKLKDMPDVTLVERYEPIEAIQLFDKNDRLICTVEGDEDRRIVPLSQVSSQMQQAMLAAEDHHFYEHNGVNISSILRATLANMHAGHVVEGGSTITQQLVKNLFYTEGGKASRSMDRKLKEALTAYELERRYSKERILEMYLNQVYFGSNAYGIERAASRYFDKSAAQLTIAEAAFLAGLVKAPSELGTVANRSAAIARQHEIIDKMEEYGYITSAQKEKARKQKLSFKPGSNPLQKYPYYVSYVLEQLHDKFSQAEMRKQGLRVYTNLDPQAQTLAEKTLEDDVKKAPKGLTQLALVSVNVQDGAVFAMVGGVGNFWKHQFNRATNPHTAGSSFKPFVYLTAFEKGVLGPDSTIDDTKLVVKQQWGLPDYAPKNFDGRFLGPIPVRKALALSRNVCSIRIAQMVGIDSVVETARLAGVTTKLEPNLSLALGSSAVTPLDMAGAYSTFARMGVAVRPQLLRRIENNRGQVVEVFQSKVDKVFAVEPVAQLVDCMQGVVKFGTGTQAKLADRPVAGKTGTADAGKDIWFVGYTPDTVTAVWGGNDENKEIEGKHVTGGDVMAKIWNHYMKAYYDVHPTPPGSFVAPTGPTRVKPQQQDQKNGAGGAQLAKQEPQADQSKVEKNNGPAPIPTSSGPEALVRTDVAPTPTDATATAGNSGVAGSSSVSSTASTAGGGTTSGLTASPGNAPKLPTTESPSAPAPDFHSAPVPKTVKPVNGPTIMMPMPVGNESAAPRNATPFGAPNPYAGSTPATSSATSSSPTRLYPYTPPSKYAPVNP